MSNYLKEYLYLKKKRKKMFFEKKNKKWKNHFFFEKVPFFENHSCGFFQILTQLKNYYHQSSNTFKDICFYLKKKKISS